MSLNNLINSIENKLNNLLSAYQKEKEINLNLIQENASLVSEIKQKSKEIDDLKDKIKLMSISKSVDVSKGDIRQTKLKINEYIREIDKCIAQLNN
tara:strand:- start:2525 stop:2812 length:288 start_codon:yes stop_codon:yes gene_type:complete